MTASALLVTAGLGLLVMWPAAEAQPAKRVYRVALIHSDASAARESFDAFRHGVTELGYVEGETIALEYRVSPPSASRSLIACWYSSSA